MRPTPAVSSYTPVSDRDAVRIARHVTWVGFWCNAVLGTLKVIAGIFGRSTAMVVDGVHSFSDFFTDIIVADICRYRPAEGQPRLSVWPR